MTDLTQPYRWCHSCLRTLVKQGRQVAHYDDITLIIGGRRVEARVCGACNPHYEYDEMEMLNAPWFEELALKWMWYTLDLTAKELEE